MSNAWTDVLAFLIGAAIFSFMGACLVFMFFHFWLAASAFVGLCLLAGSMAVIFEIALACLRLGHDVLDAWRKP